MAINNIKAKNMAESEVEEGLGADEIGHFSPDDAFSHDENEVYDFIPESGIDLVETISGTSRSQPLESTTEKEYSDTANNIVWAYLKDMGHISLLTADEEYQIAKKIEEAEKKAKNILFNLPQAVNELLEIGSHLKEGSINIIDVIKNIDEINSTEEDQEKYRKKTISSINLIKKLHEKKEEVIARGANTGKNDLAAFTGSTVK